MDAARRVIINVLLASAVFYVFLVTTSYAYYLVSGDDVIAKAMFQGTVIGGFYSPLAIVAALALEFGGRLLPSQDLLRLAVVVASTLIALLGAVAGLIATGTAWGFVLTVPAAILACLVLLPPVTGSERVESEAVTG